MSEIQAGPELDALIAEKVMRCTVKYIESTPFCGCGQTCDYPHGEPDREGQLYGYLQHYSTDIAAAWQVLESVLAKGWGVRVERMFRVPTGWRCVVGYESTLADTAPLAICRAALKAVQS